MATLLLGSRFRIGHYAARRLVRALLLLAGVALCCLLFLELCPGDFFSEARLNADISPKTLQALRSEHALDASFGAKIAYWLKSVGRGDWGYSLAYNIPVGPLILSRAVNTLLLTTSATIATWLIGILIGVWTARRRRRFETVVRAGTSVMMAVPDLAIVLLLMIAAMRVGLPVGGMNPEGTRGGGALEQLRAAGAHLVVPCIAVLFSILPPILVNVISAMSEVLQSSFIRAAEGHGIAPFRLLYRHALPAAANPLITLFGMSIGGLLSSSLVVEAAVGWPGLGALLLQATLDHDLYVILAGILAGSALLVIGNLIADVLLFTVDPRVAHE